jgi:ribosome-associated protein
VRALQNELHMGAKALGVRHHRVEGEGLHWWVVMDFGDVVVHLLQPEARAYYDLDRLYGDCARLDWESIALPSPSDLSAAEA